MKPFSVQLIYCLFPDPLKNILITIFDSNYRCEAKFGSSNAVFISGSTPAYFYYCFLLNLSLRSVHSYTCASITDPQMELFNVRALYFSLKTMV